LLVSRDSISTTSSRWVGCTHVCTLNFSLAFPRLWLALEREYTSECDYLYGEPVGLMMVLENAPSTLISCSGKWGIIISDSLPMASDLQLYKYTPTCDHVPISSPGVWCTLVFTHSHRLLVLHYIYQITGYVVHLENEVLSVP
jgi:hypothetical protein